MSKDPSSQQLLKLVVGETAYMQGTTLDDGQMAELKLEAAAPAQFLQFSICTLLGWFNASKAQLDCRYKSILPDTCWNSVPSLDMDDVVAHIFQ